MEICCLLLSFRLILQLLDSAAAEPITTGIAVVSAAGLSAFLASYQHLKCRWYECCTDPWLNDHNFTSLNSALRSRVYGQHLAVDTVTKAVRAHWTSVDPKKALVLSFHGWTGGGKNYVSQIIAESLYSKGLKSSFVHLFVPETQFVDSSHVDEYKVMIQRWIRGNVSNCARSLFIFDELDKIPTSVLDAIRPYIDYHPHIAGVDYRKSIFIFLSNTGGSLITTRTLQQHKKGLDRTKLTLTEMEKLIHAAAYNGEDALRFSALIAHHLIDHYVPFLPLERQHVRQCIHDVFVAKGREPTPEQLNLVEEMLTFGPPGDQVFSTSGCKRIAQKVELALESMHDDDGYDL